MADVVEYELMQVIKTDKTPRSPEGIDEESCILGDAKSIIIWLLKHDDSVNHLSVTKRKRR